jgi:hypothetical protein
LVHKGTKAHVSRNRNKNNADEATTISDGEIVKAIDAVIGVTVTPGSRRVHVSSRSVRTADTIDTNNGDATTSHNHDDVDYCDGDDGDDDGDDDRDARHDDQDQNNFDPFRFPARKPRNNKSLVGSLASFRSRGIARKSSAEARVAAAEEHQIVLALQGSSVKRDWVL